jgi:hypothetical protein
MSIATSEQDTSINFGRDEKTLTLYSNDTTFITMLRRRGYDVSDTDSIGGVTIVIPKIALTIRANTKKSKEKVQAKPKRTISPEHMAKLKAGREKKVKV